jgi:hypothetical protein
MAPILHRVRLRSSAFDSASGRREVEVTLSLITDAGQAIAVAGIGREVTEQRRLQDALEDRARAGRKQSPQRRVPRPPFSRTQDAAERRLGLGAHSGKPRARSGGHSPGGRHDQAQCGTAAAARQRPARLRTDRRRPERHEIHAAWRGDSRAHERDRRGRFRRRRWWALPPSSWPTCSRSSGRRTRRRRGSKAGLAWGCRLRRGSCSCITGQSKRAAVVSARALSSSSGSVGAPAH